MHPIGVQSFIKEVKPGQTAIILVSTIPGTCITEDENRECCFFYHNRSGQVAVHVEFDGTVCQAEGPILGYGELLISITGIVYGNRIGIYFYGRVGGKV